LLAPEVSDADGNTEDRNQTVSVFNGAAPTVRIFASEDAEVAAIGAWLSERAKEGVATHEFGVFVRSPKELERARAAVEKAGLPFEVLDEKGTGSGARVSISTMHLAKRWSSEPSPSSRAMTK
jgi:hypothetical protein